MSGHHRSEEQASADPGGWDVDIRSDQALLGLDLKELWRARDLLMLMVRRDLVAQYKQTLLGPLWHVVQPLTTTLAFALVFGRAAGLSPTGIPALLFYMSGIITWNYFANVVTRTSKTFLANAQLMSKVYFPRLVIPASTTISSLLSFGIQLATFLALYLWYMATDSGRTWAPTSGLLVLPLLVLLMSFLAMGLGILVSAMTIKYRDLSFLVGFGIQLLMYASPVIMPLERVARIPWLFRLLKLNPMTPVIEATRSMFFGGPIDWAGLGYCAGAATVMMALGVVVFHRVERYFADIV